MSEIIFDLKVFDPKNVCRFCLSKSQLGNLYSSSIVDGDIIAIPDMILHCLDITVSVVNTRNEVGKLINDGI